MPTQPHESVLTSFEQEVLPPRFREYYAAKRQNLFATIQAFQPLWKCFMLLDEIWLREFDDMNSGGDPNKLLPLMLYMNSHVKARLSFELGFSGCIPEAHSLIRDGIESAAHAHRLFSDPTLMKAWLAKNDGPAGADAFNKEFWHCKEDRLFEGLGELYKSWKQFSEVGSHTNLNSIVQRFVIDQTPSNIEYRLNYTGAEPSVLAQVLYHMILVFRYMEDVLFKDCEARLKLDAELDSMRRRFDSDREKTRLKIIRAFNIPPPGAAAPANEVAQLAQGNHADTVA
jgi:hypothetical protein